MASRCKICGMEPAGDNGYCADCKHPAEIRGYCRKCGNRFKLQPEELQNILELSGVEHITPQLGQTVVVSNCEICADPEEKSTIAVYK